MSTVISISKRNNHLDLFRADVRAVADSLQVEYCHVESRTSVMYIFKNKIARDSVASMIDRNDYRMEIY